MTYGDWDRLFLNDLVILGKSAVWMESGIPGAAPSRLPNATTKARLAQVCKSNTERCALIGVTDPDEIDALAANRLTEDHIEDWREAVAQNPVALLLLLALCCRLRSSLATTVPL